MCAGWQVLTGAHVNAACVCVCVCLCVRASAYVCLEAYVLPCPSPRQKTPVSPAISQSWQLRARQRNERGRKERGRKRKRRRRAWIWERWRETWERGKRGRHPEGVAIARSALTPLPPSPLFGDQVFSFWGGTTGKKRSLPSCFIWHLCTCTCRVGRWGGGRDKASDKAGL